MSNSEYTFMQVVDGKGGSFSQKGDTGVSEGVKTLQTYLKEIGYTISDASGRFQSSTKKAVEGFQYELGITQDGIAGQGTCLRLNTVHSSKYFNKYGKPLSTSQWGQSKILAGNFNDTDLLARIILAESGYENLDDEKGVAIVIKNRSVNSSSRYWETPEKYPKASIYARVIGKSSQYATANSSNAIARVPRRGYHGKQADGFIDPAWKKAVSLAGHIIDGTKISVTAYKVDGLSISSQTKTINTTDNKQYLNQTAWSLYKSYYDSGDVVASVQPLTFLTTTKSNFIYKTK